jgi:hypothetical protein
MYIYILVKTNLSTRVSCVVNVNCGRDKLIQESKSQNLNGGNHYLSQGTDEIKVK